MNPPRLAKSSSLLLSALLAASVGLAQGGARAVEPWDDAPPASDSGKGESMAVFMLKQLNEREERAYERYERAIAADDVAQVKGELQSVVDGYDALISQSPAFAPAYVSYGLMLNRIGETKPSYAMFLKADELDPNIAIVKNQLGNYMAEEGKYPEAYGFYLQAIDLAPKEPLYYVQAGNILLAYRKFFVADALFTSQEIDAEIQERFRRAAKISPDDHSYKLRYAQSFFEIENPNWEKALETWQEMMSHAVSEDERQVVTLYIARVRFELGHHSAVRKLLKKVDHPNMQKTKQDLLDALDE